MQQILWTCCVFLSSLNNTFFSVLVIIFSNKSYFCFNYTKYFFHSCHEFFFSGTSNYFSNVYQELFFNWAENYFSWYRKFIFWSTMHWGPCIWSGLVRVFWLPWVTIFELFWKNSSYVSGVSVCIFVALYLCNFVPLYLCIFVCSDVCARANKLRLKVLWVDA